MTDEELIGAVRAGDRNAYGVLVERYHGAIFRRCFQMAGNAPDAEELAHQAFVDGYVKLDQLREPAKFFPWLRTLALNVCRMWYRQRNRQSVMALNEEALPAAADPDDAADYAHLAWALNRLSTTHRVVLVLHYFEELSYADIASFLDVPMGTVMSRLYRARKALKGVLRTATDEEEPLMTDTDDFRHEVEAEIAVLLEMFHEDRKAMERLSLVLQHSPDRFAQLLRDAKEPAKTDAVASLLPHLGVESMRIVLGLCFSPDAVEQAQGTAVLQAFVTRCRSHFYGSPAGGGMPSRNAYRLMDTFIAMPEGAEKKAGLLVEVMDSTNDEGVALLLTSVLLCNPDAAFPLLLERFWSAQDAESLYGSSGILHALCQTGSRFCEALVDSLSGSDTDTLTRALAGVEALSRSIDAPWLTEASAMKVANERRTRPKWGTLRREDLGARVLEELIEATAALMTHDRADVREPAILALGRLGTRDHAARLRECLSHGESSTRRTAILALAEMGGTESVDLLIKAAETGESAERRAAIEALSRLRVQEALPLFVRLAHEPDKGVRLAAVAAIGDVGGDDAWVHLDELTRSEDVQVRKAAAKALCKKPSRRGPLPATLKRQAMAGRADAQPITYRSLDAAIRFAMAEIRPYEHKELTDNLAHVCSDYSATRRYLIEEGIMERSDGVYELTELGKAVWRVEHFVMESFLGVGLGAGV
jgi:RNA polymerase sigma-70 factor, ECF subfamily